MSESINLAVSKSKPKINQINLVTDIFKAIEKQGIKEIPTRVFNKIISCADEIIVEASREDIIAADGAGLNAWLKSDDTGKSSEFLALTLSGRSREFAVPYDVADFGRCVRMLRVCPGLKDKLDIMKEHGPIWKRLVESWDLLEEYYYKNRFQDLYETIKKIHELAEPVTLPKLL